MSEGPEASGPAPAFPDPATRDRVRDLLARCGYRDGPIRRRLGAEGTFLVRALGRETLEARIRDVEGPLGVLLRLYLVGRPVSADVAAATLGAEDVRALIDSGLAVRRADALWPRVLLTPVEDFVLAADLPDRHAARAADYVLGPGGVTMQLHSMAFPRTVDSLLDLGCGCGSLAVLASRRAARVVATDVNPRAIAFARFNAELAGLDAFECRSGDLFDPVRDDRFDAILCNPPYVIAPSPTFVYRDGGTEICRRIVQEAAGHLTDAGYMQTMVEWPRRAGEDWRAEVERWLDGSGCDAWLLRTYEHDARGYADVWLRQEQEGDPPAEAVERWLAHLRRLGIEAVCGGMLVLRRARSAAPIRTLRDAPPFSTDTVGAGVERWVRAQSLLASVERASELLDVPLAPSPGLERIRRTEPTGEGWTERSRQLRSRDGLRFAARVDPVAEEIVGLLDGRTTPRQSLERFAERHGVPVEPFLRGLPDALAKLLELGLLVPPDPDHRRPS